MNASFIKDSWLLFSDYTLMNSKKKKKKNNNNNNIGSTCNPSDIAHTHPLHTIHGLQGGENKIQK